MQSFGVAYLPDNEDCSIWREKGDEDEGVEEEQRHNHDWTISILGGKPAIEEDAREDTNVTRVTVAWSKSHQNLQCAQPHTSERFARDSIPATLSQGRSSRRTSLQKMDMQRSCPSEWCRNLP